MELMAGEMLRPSLLVEKKKNKTRVFFVVA
jgi:hypothetical protein